VATPKTLREDPPDDQPTLRRQYRLRKPENKVTLDFLEGLNNKIRVIQRRSYGLRHEEYLRLKILTCMLPPRARPVMRKPELYHQILA
jgi:hypothetical protein